MQPKPAEQSAAGQNSTNLGRRYFLKKSLRLGAGLASLGILGLAFHEDQPVIMDNSQLKSFDFRVQSNGPEVAVAEGVNRAELVKRCLSALGGMDKFIRPGESVLLKVNAGFAVAPEMGATTHPETLGAIIELCRQAGAGRIVVSDNPIGEAGSAFQINGLAGACVQHKVELLIPKAGDFVNLSLPEGRLIKNWPVLLPALQVDKVIGLAPVKSHVRAVATMGIKNFYGLLGGRRGVFHQDINQIILELAMLVRPTLSVLDGVKSMLHNGPTGGSLDDLINSNTMIVGTDPVAVDALGAGLLGLQPAELAYLAMCQQAGLGTIAGSRIVRL